MMTNLPDWESGFLDFFSTLASLTLRMARGDLEDSDFIAGDLGLDDGGDDVMLLLLEEGMKSSNGMICVWPVGGLVAFHWAIVASVLYKDGLKSAVACSDAKKSAWKLVMNGAISTPTD